MGSTAALTLNLRTRRWAISLTPRRHYFHWIRGYVGPRATVVHNVKLQPIRKVTSSWCSSHIREGGYTSLTWKCKCLTVSDLKRGQYWTMGVVAIGYAPSWAGVIVVVVVVVAMALCYCPTFTARRQSSLISAQRSERQQYHKMLLLVLVLTAGKTT